MSIYSERLLGVQDKIRKTGLEAAVICEPTSIRYLLNRNFVHVGERLMALAVPKEGKSILFINRLFPVSGDESFDVVYHDDTDIATEGLARFLPSGKIGIDRFLYSQFLIQLLEQRNDIVPKVGSYVVEELRMIKGEDEKELMRRASVLNDEIIAKVPELIRPGMTELELADLLIAEYKKVGEPWAPLVGFGPGAADPHHVNSDTVISPGVVLVDAGQETNGYFSDMTRTFFYKEVSEEERKVYEIVKEANRRGKAAVKPGVRFCDVDAAARDYITEMGYGEYFTHRLGHNIGMQLHEEPSVSASNTGTVEEGMTFSIEPGIYLPGKFGVRIEDLVLATKDGCEVLNSYPREIQIIG